MATGPRCPGWEEAKRGAPVACGSTGHCFERAHYNAVLNTALEKNMALQLELEQKEKVFFDTLNSYLALQHLVQKEERENERLLEEVKLLTRLSEQELSEQDLQPQTSTAGSSSSTTAAAGGGVEVLFQEDSAQLTLPWGPPEVDPIGPAPQAQDDGRERTGRRGPPRHRRRCRRRGTRGTGAVVSPWLASPPTLTTATVEGVLDQLPTSASAA
mmetsp:Transcript_21529/g.49261  ORF Transcript_21529/g.49261 Transcript_21529/m.49261 type:complete len:214 (-) Transcript_21529:122-763(-)